MDADPDATKAAEWLLDNDYQVHRAIRQIEQDLPEPFYTRLPHQECPEGVFPRVFVLAHSLLASSRLQISLGAAVSSVRDAQVSEPLTIAELWAFPTMLRLACLETLTLGFGELFPAVRVPFQASALARSETRFDAVEKVARSIANLGLIASIPWDEFFDQTSRVEEILATDPAGTYARMDFQTRDRYRRAVEEIAETTDASEWDVSRLAIEKAFVTDVNDPAQGHVGYWLIGHGRLEFEADLRCVPSRRTLFRRRLLTGARQLYAAALLLVWFGVLILPAFYMAAIGAGATARLIYLLVAIVPASILAITLVNWAITQIISPTLLPKLDFDKGLPTDCRTLVAVPVLVATPAEADALFERLEAHRLANPDPLLQFALLSDLPDAPSERQAGDDEIEAALVAGTATLNKRYGINGSGPYHLLHRARRYNPDEGCWMGWERKRGKLEQLNRLLLGEDESGFEVREGDNEALESIRFVITVDADTRLPTGSANRLVGTLAHPLNKARIDPASGRIVAGYSIIQPRVEISPESGNRSIFARLYTGDTSIDIYSRAVSDVYQDLFEEGIFVGKGIYEVEPFHLSVDGRVPENAILSHDLFEGISGRCALATDIVLYESFPSTLLEYLRRSHRWIRGDWQLLPWLWPNVPRGEGGRLPNPLSGLDRWKILDNLRRSVIPPSLVLFALAGWLVLPGSPWLWTLLTIFAPGAHLFTELISGLARGPRRGSIRGRFAQLADQTGRWFLAITFLPKEAAVASHAIATALWRMFVSRRHMLEWTSAAHVAARMGRIGSQVAFWRAMWSGPAAAAIIGSLILLLRPSSLPAAVVLLVLWLISPEVAALIGRPRRPEVRQLDANERQFLRKIARQTWLYFETFAGPQDHWLPPDNFQEPPFEEIAHRTSPTNIGMMLISGFAAWDLGHLGSTELSARLANTFDGLERLEKHRGHFLNWYDTRTLLPLEPRYVSSVDSGNLAVCLVVVASGCREAAAGPMFGSHRWGGLRDILAIIGDLGQALSPRDRAELDSVTGAILTAVDAAESKPGSWHRTLSALAEGAIPKFESTVLRLMDTYGHSPAASGLSTWSQRLVATNHAMRRDLDELAPWWTILASPPPGHDTLADTVAPILAPSLGVGMLRNNVRKLDELLSPVSSRDDEAALWAIELQRAVQSGLHSQQELQGQLEWLAQRATELAFEMDFTPLYDRERRLFHIGYNVSSDRLDPHYYDLLATEARIGSYFAIAKGDVPASHWFFLGRPLTREASGISLLSWNGSMFEYLMAPIFMRSGVETLVGESERVAVDIQRDYAESLGVPWGISESAFAMRDPEHRYRYQAFGSPGLGLKRDLGKDLVIAPYASALALATQPDTAVENLQRLWSYGAAGSFGFVEAIDFTKGRAEGGGRFTPVRAYMAHHQGMILAAIGNALNGDIFVQRFRAEPRMRTVDLLLSERIPREVPSEIERIHERPLTPQPTPASPAPYDWIPTSPPRYPQVQLLGNGRLSCSISEAGGGGLHWRQRAVTRFVPDATSDQQGLWIYVSDEDSGAVWSAARQPTGAIPDEYRVVFHPHVAEFHRRDHGIALRTEVGVVENDDVEIRRVTIVNESALRRTLRVTSYGEVVLAPPLDDERHPAFSKLFVYSEFVPRLDGLLFTRRSRHVHETPPAMVHRLIGVHDHHSLVSFECDRRAFIGRGGDLRMPRALRDGLSNGAGWTLDPVMVLQARVELPPHESRELAFVTAVAGSRTAALEIAERYTALPSIEWAFDDSAAAVAREAQRLEIEPQLFPQLQSLGSMLVYPHPAMRGRETVLRTNHLGQPGLWGLGLSGDRPILLAKLGAADKCKLMADLVKGHRLWSKRGLEVDLVMLNMASSSYLEPTRDELTDLLNSAGAGALLGRKGGIHLLSTDQIGPQLIQLLESVARIVMDEEGGGLAQQLALIHTAARDIPAFQAVGTPDDGPDVPLEPADGLRFENGLGGFTEDGREYVVHLQAGDHTPAPWCNVLANDRFGTLVTESGGGFTWSVNSGENRLTPWSNDPVCDTPGEVLYLRDEETGAVWTPTPFAPQGTACEVRHGLGYSRWRQRSHHVDQDMLVFVPPDDPVKIVRFRVKNHLRRPRRLTATYYAEWVLGSMRSIAVPGVVTEYDSEHEAILARNPWNPDFAERIAFLAASRAPHSMTLDRHEFLGLEGNLRSPAGLYRWGFSRDASSRVDPCAAYQVHIDLGPEGEQELVFVLGQGKDRADAIALARKWRSASAADAGIAATEQYWRRTLQAVEVRTPDPAFDLMINQWLLYQTLSSRICARAGFYQASGGIGFRDQLQDMLAVLHAQPERVRAHILACAAHQFEEGDVMHWWHPPMDRGVRTRCSDDLLWLPYVVSCYVRATGDFDILSEQVPFLRAAPLAAEEEDRYAMFESVPAASLFDHCVRAIEHGVTRGARGLPLMGSGDWNDGMDRVGRQGRGESVWLAWFTIVTLESFAPIARRLSRDDVANAWLHRAAEIREAAEAHAWDGAWYRRAYDDAGEPWGSTQNEECRIDSISQSWAVLAGANPDRLRTALASAQYELIHEDARLIRLLTPPFDKTDRDPGYIKAYPPGVRENGGQYSHAAAWLGFGFAHMRDGNEAYRIFDLMNPVKLTDVRERAEHYRGEPYVLAGDVADGGDRTGRAGWTWYTGSSAWLWRLGVEEILGVKLDEGGISIAPCLPRHWKECEVILRRPKGSIAIRIEDPDGFGAGTVKLTVNGEPWSGSRVVFPEDGSTTQVVAAIHGQADMAGQHLRSQH